MRGADRFLPLLVAASVLAAAPASARELAGTTTAVHTETEARLAQEAIRILELGSEIFRDERIATDASGTAQLLFLDRSSITIAPSSELIIDSYVYDPQTGAGELTVQATKGLLRFVGGQLSKNAAVTINTPSASIGIRGGIAIVEVEEGATSAMLGFGTMTVSAQGTVRTVIKPGFGVTVPQGGAPGGVRAMPASFVERAATAAEGRSGEATVSASAVQEAQANSGLAEENSGEGVPQGETRSATIAGITAQPVAERAIADAKTFIVAPVAPSGPPPGPPPSADALSAVALVDNGSLMTRSPTIEVLDARHARLTLDGESVIVPLPQTGPVSTTTATIGGKTFSLVIGPSTPRAEIAVDGSVRSFSLSPDLVDASEVPLVRGDLFPSAAATRISDLMLIEGEGGLLGDLGEDRSSTVLQVSFVLAGEGLDQTSGIHVTAGPWMFPTAAHLFPTLTVGNAGSVRLASTGGQYTFGGGLSSLSLRENGNPFLGSDREAFLLGNHADGTDRPVLSFERPDEEPAGGAHYDTMTVATQTESRPIGDFTRTERTLDGFAAGLLSHAGDDGGAPLVVRSSGHGLDGATLEFLPAKNSMAARLRLEDVGDEDAEVAGWDLAFGHAGDAGPGAMLDDDHYAALGDAAGSSIRLDGAGSVPLTPDGANIFIVGSDLTTLADGFPGGAAPCVCAFMEWGVWGGSADYELPGGDARRDFVHMGTWVAGVAPTIEELPTDLQATYSGHVLGEVARDTGEGWARYVQGGSMTMDFDFRDRTGNLAIEFDGKSFGGTMHGHGREFGGNLSGSGVTGAAAGAFFKGPKSPVQGVGGDWHVRADDYRAGGAMVGEQVDAAAAH